MILREYARFRGSVFVTDGSYSLDIIFDKDTNSDLVLRLFDLEMATLDPELAEEPEKEDGAAVAVSLPGENGAAQEACRQEQQAMIPEKIREMIRIYKDWRGFPIDRTAIFYSQARFMADYEDSFPWEGSFDCYCPTYQD